MMQTTMNINKKKNEKKTHKNQQQKTSLKSVTWKLKEIYFDTEKLLNLCVFRHSVTCALGRKEVRIVSEFLGPASHLRTTAGSQSFIPQQYEVSISCQKHGET